MYTNKGAMVTKMNALIARTILLTLLVLCHFTVEARGESAKNTHEIFDDKTHIGSDFAIYYGSDGVRIKEYKGLPEPETTFRVDGDILFYRSGDIERSVTFESIEGRRRYRMCEEELCVEVRIVEGNPLGLAPSMSELDQVLRLGAIKVDAEIAKLLFSGTTFFGEGYSSFNQVDGNRIVNRNGNKHILRWWKNIDNQLCLTTIHGSENCGVSAYKLEKNASLFPEYFVFYGNSQLIDRFAVVLGNVLGY